MEAWTSGQLEIQSWQAIPERMAALSLTAADGMAKAWFVDKDGSLTGGAAAVNGAVGYCWWLRPFTHLYQLPGMRQLQDRIYQWVAGNRHRLPGSASQCHM